MSLRPLAQNGHFLGMNEKLDAASLSRLSLDEAAFLQHPHHAAKGRGGHCNQVHEWKKRMLEYAEDVFGGNAVEAQYQGKEVEKLHANIGQLSMDNGLLSKVPGYDR